jgi:large subunit ribosomal protein L30
MATLRITQVRSEIGQTTAHKGALRALGLRKIGQSVAREESAALAGALRKVAHLVRVEGADGA